MNSKERVLKTFAHEKTDRVPINYKANAGINSRLIQHYGLQKDDREGLLKVLGVDFREANTSYRGVRLHENIPGRAVDPEWGIHTRWIEHESGGYWDFCDFPLKDADEEQIAKWPMPSPDDYDYSLVYDKCRKYDEYALYAGNPGFGDIINATGMIRSMEQVLIDLATDDPAGMLLIDRRIDVQLKILERTIEAAKGNISFIWMGEDLGTQNSPMISMDMYRKHLKPRHQKYIDIAKAYGLPVMIHSCGSSSWAYEDFIEMGIDAVDTLQPEAKNMSPSYLKSKFGGRLSFHGCISTAGPVAYGTAEDVVEDVRNTLEIMMHGGGYFFAPTHQLQDNSHVLNVAAMYDSAKKYGCYQNNV